MPPYEESGWTIRSMQDQKENKVNVALFKVFPSPAMTKVSFEWIGESLPLSGVLRIRNPLGSLVLEERIDKDHLNFTLDASAWSSGIYFYSYIWKQQQLHNAQFSVLH